MPQPGMNGMEPVFGEAYGGHRGLLSPYPLAMSPQGGRTDFDQSVLLMLGSPATPRKRPFELLSDLVDDGGLGEEDLPPGRWDVSALDEMARYTRLGLGVGDEAPVLMGRWGRGWEEDGLRKPTHAVQAPRPPLPSPGDSAAAPGEGRHVAVVMAIESEVCQQAGGGVRRSCTVEVYQVEQQQEEEEEEVGERCRRAPGLVLELCSEEHNYSLGNNQGGPWRSPRGDPHTHANPQAEETPVGSTEPQQQQEQEEDVEVSPGETNLELQEEQEDDEDEETTVEAELSSSSATECEVEPEPARPRGSRPQKRRCFWEYRRAREAAAAKSVGGEVRWSLSWSSSTLPSTLYRREGKKGRRKARKTDASDLTPNPQKLHSIGEQLQKLNAAIDGMGPVNELPAVVRARSRKEKNKLASRACRLKKKAQHEANKIKLWGLNQEYENLLGALLRIKEVIRRRVESSEEEDTDDRGMTQRLEDILKESSGPLVAGRTKDFVQRILAASERQGKDPPQPEDETAG